jgi:hypothetical protein
LSRRWLQLHCQHQFQPHSLLQHRSALLKPVCLMFSPSRNDTDVYNADIAPYSQRPRMHPAVRAAATATAQRVDTAHASILTIVAILAEVRNLCTRCLVTRQQRRQRGHAVACTSTCFDCYGDHRADGRCVDRDVNGVCRVCLLPSRLDQVTLHPAGTFGRGAAHSTPCPNEVFRGILLLNFYHHRQDVERLAGRTFLDVHQYFDCIKATANSTSLFLRLMETLSF